MCRHHQSPEVSGSANSIFSERSHSLYAVACAAVGNAPAPYSGGCNFLQHFYCIWYIDHPLTFMKNFTEIIPVKPLCRGS